MFIVFSVKRGDSKEIANPEVVDEIAVGFKGLHRASVYFMDVAEVQARGRMFIHAPRIDFRLHKAQNSRNPATFFRIVLKELP